MTVFDYPGGSIKIKYQNRTLPYAIFDKLQKVDQGAVLEKKRLGAVLEFVKDKQKSRDEKGTSSSPSKQHLGGENTNQIRKAACVKRKRPVG